MEKLIFESKFEQIFFNSENRELRQIWFDTTVEITVAEVKSEQLRMADLFDEYKPLYHLADCRNFLFPIAPDLQDWINQEIASRVKNSGTLKSAMVLSSDVITAMSIEQLGSDIERDLGKKTKAEVKSEYSAGVFPSVEDARTWFYS